MPNEYVPYEERQRRQAEQEASAARSRAEEASAALEDVRGQLRRLRTSSTDSFLEVLVPARGLMKRRKPIVHKPAVMGGPSFHIADVVSTYRIPNAIFHPPFKDASGYFTDAFVAPDGRVWEFQGSGDAENTWQVLAATALWLDELAAEDLRRIATALRSR